MTAWNDDPQPEEEPVAIDVYGIKTSVRPGDLGEPMPASWADVRDQVRGHLLRLAVAPTRLLAELFEGVTRLVRGVSALPGATAARMKRAQLQADEQEERLQLGAARRKMLPNAADARAENGDALAGALVARLEEVLQRLRIQGRDGTVVLMRNGSILVILGTAADAREAIEAAAEDMVLMMTTTGTTSSVSAALEAAATPAGPSLPTGGAPDHE
jgi:hypothetical protein